MSGVACAEAADIHSSTRKTCKFAAFDPAFNSITGSSPTSTIVIEKDYAFAHEAGVFLDASNELFITSNRLLDGKGAQRVEVSKISLDETPASIIVLYCPLIEMANGGVNYGEDEILFCAQGSFTQRSGLFLMSTQPPHKSKALITDFYGRSFNSVNDVVVHSDGSVWFTDPCYGFEQGYRPRPRLPNQIYRYEPSTGDIRVVADGFGRPNGVCFSPREEIVFITDTDWIHGDGTTNDSRPSTM